SWSTGDTTASITVDSSGIYTVTTTDFLGCQSTTRDTVVALPCLGFMENDLENAISVYPNPASDHLNFKWNASGTKYFDVHLYNSIGAEVMRSEKIKVNSVTENKIDISQLPAGIYLMVIENGTDRVTRKIVKNN
ncbi:MAG TPA: T9SS type A sorting domain-containing protein, partial [Bacteroidia bacterium]|nr:T9SS type A sorting domain-containing protein [Bacteroidia bacterium]